MAETKSFGESHQMDQPMYSQQTQQKGKKIFHGYIFVLTFDN